MEQIKEQRKPRSYKATDSVYEKAKKEAEKKKTTLAEMIEQYLIRLSKSK